jgi:thioredoxin reductase (NADPH)
MKMKYDVIIIGGGAAGLSAALWCDDLKLKDLLLERESELGGQLLRVYNPIKNHLGIEAENGRQLRDVFVKQIANRQFDIRLGAEIELLNLSKKSITITGGDALHAEAIIIATGVRRRKLNVVGEEKFTGKGIIESGKRDGETVKNKNVCIVGGGDAALENALILAETAATVTLVHRKSYFRARDEFLDQVKNNPKIEVLTETVVREIDGDESIQAVKLENFRTKLIFKKYVEAILIRIGVEPNSGFLNGRIDLDQNGYIKINQNCETNIKNIYAVGDVANPISPTVSSAVGMGATAAKNILFRLNS